MTLINHGADSNIRVSTETLRKIDRTSIELADGSGDHWGSIAVYHHLHCLVSPFPSPFLQLYKILTHN